MQTFPIVLNHFQVLHENGIHTKESVMVVAHPDDEILWFSSIFSKVDHIFICFEAVRSNPIWTEGRTRSLSEYPFDTVSSLHLVESEVFEGVDWERPITTDYGLKITEKNFSDKTYKSNFYELKSKLRKHLRGYQNVFTHNPWGEYGHVEHVQVYRVIRALKDELGFNLWYSNYVSNKSFALMVSESNPVVSSSIILPTDKKIAKQIEDLYKKNNCWTWYDDYMWCEYDAFLSDNSNCQENGRRAYGKVRPINFITIERDDRKKKSGLKVYLSKLKTVIARLIGKGVY